MSGSFITETFARYPLFRCWLLLVTVSLLAVGCAPPVPQTIKVKGMVTFGGEKLKTGTISFVPKSITGDIHPVAVELDKDGNFDLSTFNVGDGIAPGEYLVTVVSYERAPDPATPGQEIWAIPRKYGDAQKSGLTAEIRAEDPQPIELDFNLEGEKNK